MNHDWLYRVNVTTLCIHSICIKFFSFAALTVSISEPDYRVVEDRLYQEVCVELSGPADEVISVAVIARQSVPVDALGNKGKSMDKT